MVDTETTGDAQCIGDAAGELPSYSPVFPGFRLNFGLGSGLFPLFVNNDFYGAVFPSRMTMGPDGLLWVTDEGDAGSITQGQVLIIDPNNGPGAFAAFGPIR